MANSSIPLKSRKKREAEETKKRCRRARKLREIGDFEGKDSLLFRRENGLLRFRDVFAPGALIRARVDVFMLSCYYFHVTEIFLFFLTFSINSK
jgi:hypothetical protein